MPRLLSINNYHYRRGGSDVVYFDHAQLMASLGFEPGYFSMHHPQNLATPWSRFFVDEIEFDTTTRWGRSCKWRARSSIPSKRSASCARF